MSQEELGRKFYSNLQESRKIPSLSTKDLERLDFLAQHYHISYETEDGFLHEIVSGWAQDVFRCGAIPLIWECIEHLGIPQTNNDIRTYINQAKDKILEEMDRPLEFIGSALIITDGEPTKWDFIDGQTIICRNCNCDDCECDDGDDVGLTPEQKIQQTLVLVNDPDELVTPRKIFERAKAFAIHDRVGWFEGVKEGTRQGEYPVIIIDFDKTAT